MSVLGILSSSLINYGVQSMQNRMQSARKEFQQLGQDLQTGNLTAAQSDFATLQQLQPQASSSSSTQSTNPISQDFNQLAADLKAGNTTAAQQDFTKLQQDFQNQGTQSHHHHHHHGGGSSKRIQRGQPALQPVGPGAAVGQPVRCPAGLRRHATGLPAIRAGECRIDAVRPDRRNGQRLIRHEAVGAISRGESQ